MSNIIKIGDFELEKKDRYSRFRKEKDRCTHRQITLDDQGQTIHCSKCGDQLSAYWVVEEIMWCYERNMEDLKKKIKYQKSVSEDLAKEHRFLKVLRKIQSAWRGKNKMAVCCPWCGVGIMPEDGLGNTTIAPDIDFNRKRLLRKKHE